ncbi:oligoendopeptidase F [Ligilactobacillus salitolerans]|uniref:Oligopeptidase F n=1 Tax=Ligilactobacillus salitolerans TaxID=1808352 RepID=A0A401IVV5_9LACO|nr:oligoendopeptidase F [Ligilactobacillus salitolerans]GBG95652.1 oligoendopeptidase F [Ligilactobacillus salitolerans]
MAEKKIVPLRADVKPELTWDLTLVFKTEQDFEHAFAKVKEKAADFQQYQGTLQTGAAALLQAVKSLLAIDRQAEKVYVYASMKNDQDTTDSYYHGLFSRVQALIAQISGQCAWFKPEVLALGSKKLATYYQAEPGLQEYRQFLADMMRFKEHTLEPAQEELLASMSDILETPANIFSVLDDADLQFEDVIDSNGSRVELTDSTYNQLIQSPDRSVRQQAFTKLYQVYHQFARTFAQTLGSHVHIQNFDAQTRNYANARQAALNQNNIPETVYDSLVTAVHQHADLLQRYVALRQRTLGLEDLAMYDLYTPLTGKPELSYSFENAKKIALQALAVLGKDYVEQVQEAFDNRYIDVIHNKGKRGGAYSGGAYDTPPYILLNWNDDLDSLYTLVHEMGHSMHSQFTKHNQPYQYGDYSIFVAEIASTTNENLLTAYLLEHETDPQVRAYVLNYYLDGFKGTVYRQTQFAEFEQWLHETDGLGQPLTAEQMSAKYLQLNQQYYGKTVGKTPQIADEWTRIPHFYYDFYVYQYATGFAAATTLANNILDDDPKHTADYLNYLKAGSSDYPIEIMRRAGVDMTTENYLESAFQVFEERLTELEKLL